jgi:photosystem II stability/assembly factor-like uncharacterized protein
MKYLIFLLSIIMLLLSCNDQPAEPNKEDSGFVKLNFKSSNPLNDGFFLNDSIGWAVSNTDIHHTTDGGITWDTTELPNSSHYEDTRIFFIDEKTGWLAKDYEPLYKTTDAGKTWTPISAETAKCSDINRIFFLNNYTGFVAISPQYEYSYIIKTTDGGITWSNTNIKITKGFFALVLSSIEFIDDKKGFITCYEYNNDSTSGYLLKTTDCGESWTKQYIENFFGALEIDFVNSRTGWMDSGSRLFKTTDCGETWSLIKPLRNFGIHKVSFVDEYYGWISHYGVDASEYSCCDQLEMQRTTDGGNTWHYVNRKSNWDDGWYDWKEIEDIQFLDRNIGWIFSYNHHIYKTTNGGNIVK